jgi:hypothetical protein
LFIIVPADEAWPCWKFLKEDSDMFFDSLMRLSGADTGRELWVVFAPQHDSFPQGFVKVSRPASIRNAIPSATSG